MLEPGLLSGPERSFIGLEYVRQKRSSSMQGVLEVFGRRFCGLCFASYPRGTSSGVTASQPPERRRREDGFDLSEAIFRQ